MKTPSNKTLILGALCLSVVASIGAFKIGEARKMAIEDQNKQGAVYIDIQKTNTEGALLQEALRKIDLTATLGTSTTDNPFAPSPNDTLTDSLAKNLFLSYANQQSGDSKRTDDEIATELVSRINTATLPVAPYTLANVEIYSPRTKDELRTYGNTMGQIIKSNLTVIAENKNIKLKEIASIHKKIGAEMIKVKAPSAVAQLHLAAANDYSLLGDAFAIIANEEAKDPLRSLLAIRTATDAADNLNETYIQMNSYFAANGIIFEKGEAGLMWSIITSTQ